LSTSPCNIAPDARPPPAHPAMTAPILLAAAAESAASEVGTRQVLSTSDSLTHSSRRKRYCSRSLRVLLWCTGRARPTLNLWSDQARLTAIVFRHSSDWKLRSGHAVTRVVCRRMRWRGVRNHDIDDQREHARWFARTLRLRNKLLGRTARSLAGAQVQGGARPHVRRMYRRASIAGS